MSTVPIYLSEGIRRLSDLLEEATVVMSPDGIIIHANLACCELYGYALPELTGRHCTMLFAVPETSQEAFQTQKCYVAQSVHRHKEGQLLPVRLRVSYPSESTSADAVTFMTIASTDHRRLDGDMQWRYAIETSGNGLWEWNPQTGRMIRSESWYRMLGYTPASGDMQQEGFWSSYIHPGDRSRVMSTLAEYLAGTSELYQFEYRMLCGDSKWRWVLSCAKIVERNAGGPLRIIGSHRDIDDLVRTRQKQQNPLALFEMFLEQMPDAAALTTCTEEHIYVAVNDAYCQMFECQRENLIDTSAVFPQVWANDIQGRAALELMRKGAAIDDLQCRMRIKRGKEIITSLSARRVEIGGEQFVLALLRDTRQRAEAEIRLQESEARWRFAIEGNGDALWEWRVRERQIFRSTRWLEMLGLPRDADLVSLEEHGQAFFTDDLPGISMGFRELLAGRVKELAGECRLRHQSGAQLWVSYRCCTMACNKSNYPITIIGTVRDITQERARKIELEAQQNRLAHSGRLLVLGEMVAAIAHEINQPLTVISSYIGILRRKAIDPEIRELAARIENETLRAGQVIWRIRQFSRYGELTRQRCDLRELISNIVQWMHSCGRDESVVLRKNLPLEPVYADVDRVLFEQVLVNLVCNAIQSMARSEGERVVDISVSREGGGESLVDVSDRGCGLPDQIAFDVYLPFFTTKPDGLGLGLSITHSIIERHGGRLWSAARDGGGTIFSFALPAAGTDKSAARPADDFVRNVIERT